MKLYLDSFNKIIQLEINEEDSTNDLREKIEDIEFIPSNLQTLIVGTRILEEGILNNEVEEMISLSIDLKGRMRKKWKKKRTRRLQRLRRKQRMRSK